MARYFFHTDSIKRYNDPTGEELPGLVEARATAARSIAEMLRDDATVFWGTRPWAMTVTDATGLIFFSIEVHGTDSLACIKSDEERQG
jgi:hypothetical protein